MATHSRDSVSDPALTDEMVAVNYDTGDVTIKEPTDNEYDLMANGGKQWIKVKMTTQKGTA